MINYKPKIFVSYDNIYESLYRTFFKSTFNMCELYKNFELVINKINNEPSKIGFLSNRYINSKKEHYQFIISQIMSNIDNNMYSISMDSDIIFFPSFRNELESIFLSNEYDILFISENIVKDLPNPGLIIFKHNEAVLSFFKNLNDIYEQRSDDKGLLQNISSIILELIYTNNIRSKILDLNFLVNNYPTAPLISSSVCCFHATSTFNIMDKIKILNDMILKTRRLYNFFPQESGKRSEDWQNLLLQNNI